MMNLMAWSNRNSMKLNSAKCSHALREDAKNFCCKTETTEDEKDVLADHHIA